MTRPAALTLAASALLLAVLTFGLTRGSLGLSAADSLGALWGGPSDVRFAVLHLRLPRAFVAAGAGAALAGSGLILQAAIRNPLADPGILGLNAGAALAAVMLIVLAPAATSPASLAIASAAGACAAAAIVYVIAWKGGADPLRLVLAGIAVSSAAGALITLLSLRSETMALQRVLRWTTGSLNGVNDSDMALIAVGLALLLPFVAATTRWLDLIALDPITAAGRGLPLERARLSLIALAVALSALATASAGLIAFVGLMAPHLARRLAGPRSADTLGLALILGALICAAADLAGRWALAPVQFPAGLVTAILGAPYFLWLMRTRDE